MKVLLITCILSLLLFNLNVSAQFKGKTKEIISVPDSIPQFPGGPDSLASFIQKNLRWPEKEIDVQGRVIVKFTVNKHGQIINPEIVRPVYKLIDAEALRIVRLMPFWTPARINGKAVDKVYSLPINFTLSDD